MVLGASLDASSVLKFFGHMSLTSIGFGALIGLAAVAIIGKCAEERFHSDSLIQVMTTLCCAFLSFFLGESELATSGVLATVSSGFMVAYFAWPRFVAAEAMEIVWETVEFIGNTVIFFLAGLLFADTLLDSVGIIHFSDFGALASLGLFGWCALQTYAQYKSRNPPQQFQKRVVQRRTGVVRTFECHGQNAHTPSCP